MTRAAALAIVQGVITRAAPALLVPALLLSAACQRTVDVADNATTAAAVPADELDAPDVGAIRVDDEVLRAGRSLTDWPATGFNIAGQRFSPLTQITPATVRSLAVAWTAPLDGEDGGALAGPVATPVVSGEVLYATGAGGWVRAFDTRSGEVLWRSDATVSVVDAAADAVSAPPPPPPPGLALWKGRVFVGRGDGVLASVDAKTGRTLWSHTLAGDSARITSAPIVSGNLVYLGLAVGGRGAVVALDYADGKERWRFYTVPGGAEPDEAASDAALAQVRATWGSAPAPTLPGVAAPADAAAPAIAGGLVGALAYDPVHERLIVGTGGPAGDPAVGAGSGTAAVAMDRLFTRSLLALDGRTGAFVWHRQLPGAGAADRPLALAELANGDGRVPVALGITAKGDQAIIGLNDGALLAWRPLPADRPVEDERVGVATPATVALPLAEASYAPDAGLWLIPGLPSGPAGGRRPGLVAIDPVTGAARWTVRQAVAGGGVLTTAGGLAFQGSASGRLTGYSLIDGRPLWSAGFPGATLTAPSSFQVGSTQMLAIVVGAGGGRPARLASLTLDRPVAPQQTP